MSKSSGFKAGKNFTFQWNYSSSVLIGRKGFTKELNVEAARIFSRHMYKYMPYDTGYMSSAIRISANSNRGMITYTSKYGKIQYYGPQGSPVGEPYHDTAWKRNRKYHPLATSFWDKACWINEKFKVTGEINIMRKRLAKK